MELDSRDREVLLAFLEWMNKVAETEPMKLETDDEDLVDMFMNDRPSESKPNTESIYPTFKNVIIGYLPTDFEVLEEIKSRLKGKKLDTEDEIRRYVWYQKGFNESAKWILEYLSNHLKK